MRFFNLYIFIYKFWLPPSISWHDVHTFTYSNGNRSAVPHIIYYSIPAAFIIYFIKQILEFHILKPLAHMLNIKSESEKVSKTPSYPSEVEMFCEHAWELIYYAFGTSLGLSAMWNEPYLWNFQEAAIEYPFHVRDTVFWVFHF